jgi:hypothetical protein
MPEPANELERAFLRAAKDSIHRPAFYRLLLESDVFVATADDQQPEVTDGTGTNATQLRLLNLERNGVAWLPFFTSMSCLQQCLPSVLNPWQLNARALFEATLGASLVLNPNAELSKEFLPEQVTRLLDGSILGGEFWTVGQNTTVLLSQPADYPTELAAALSRAFAANAEVAAAYLALASFQSDDARPHLMVGVETRGDWNRIVADAGYVAAGVLKEGEYIDFIPMNDPKVSSIASYMTKSTKPFYKRPFLRRLFG